MSFDTRSKNRLRTYAFVVLAGAACGAAYASVRGLRGWLDAPHGAIVGILIAAPIAAFEVYAARYFRVLPFLQNLAVGTVVYVAGILGGLYVGARLVGIDTILAADWLFALAASIAFNVAFAMSRLVGLQALASFVAGVYHHPREEERIFLLVDVVGSTAMAERIGSVAFHRLLNALWHDVTDAVVETRGQIYKYVGDEIIITWPLARGVRDARCVRCYFAAVETVARRSHVYRRDFGVVPAMRAALHAGTVVAGEIGDVKKEIAFLGDTLNTAARMLQKCSDEDETFLISADVLDRVELPRGIVRASLGAIRLRGKAREVQLFTLRSAGGDAALAARAAS